jgi:hypothetical protein
MAEQKSRHRKKPIPDSLKNAVWNHYIGEANGTGNCQCCKTAMISHANFACGHIISEKMGGQTELGNLKPICTKCNSSMGTRDMKEYEEQCKFDMNKPTESDMVRVVAKLQDIEEKYDNVVHELETLKLVQSPYTTMCASSIVYRYISSMFCNQGLVGTKKHPNPSENRYVPDEENVHIPFTTERVIDTLRSRYEAFRRLEMGMYATNPHVKNHELYNRYIGDPMTTDKPLVRFQLIVDLEIYDFVTFPTGLLSENHKGIIYLINSSKPKSKYQFVLHKRIESRPNDTIKIEKSLDYDDSIKCMLVHEHDFIMNDKDSSGKITATYQTKIYIFKIIE